MICPDPEKRIDELKKLIQHHNELYYIDCEPEISDYDYDMLFQELKDIEVDHPELLTPDSPTQVMFKGKW